MILMTFLLIADLHMTGFEVKDGLVCPRMPAYAWQAVDRRYDLMGSLVPLALNQAQADFAPRFAVVAGDLAESGFGKYGRGDLIQARDLVRQHFKGETHFAYGNHDGPEAQFAELFGPLNYTFDEGDFRFIVLNSGAMNATDETSSLAALTHVKESLRTAEGRKVIVLTHQYIHPTDSKGYSMTNAAAIQQELEAYPGTLAVLNGHYHGGKIQEHNGIHYLTAKAFCQKPFSYYRCDLTADELIWTEYNLKPSEKRFVVASESRLPLRK